MLIIPRDHLEQLGGAVDDLVRQWKEALRRADATKAKIRALSDAGLGVPAALIVELAQRDDEMLAAVLAVRRASLQMQNCTERSGR